MTLRLILTRHAKSDWSDPLDPDHARPLNDRGRDAAPRIGRWMHAKGYIPAEALVSDALRTRQTWAALADALPHPVPVRFLPELYHAGPERMLHALRTAHAPCVIMVGHNPGIAGFAAGVLAQPLAHPDFGRYPTCATLVADFALESWSQLGFGTGTAVDFTVPRALQ